MNLLKYRKNNDFFSYVNPISIRQYQYNFIESFCANAINFLSAQRNNYLSVHEIKITKRINYLGVNNSAYSKVSIDVKNNVTDEIHHFTEFFIPTLMDHEHFYLNANYYTCMMYAIDYPITIKKQSCKIFSLFNSITLYAENDIAIFVRNHMSLEFFLQLFVDFEDPIYQKYMKKYKLAHTKQEMVNVVEVISKRFSVKEKTQQAVIDKLDTLFFDDYSRALYHKCYGFEAPFTLVDVIRQTLINSLGEPKAFTDLNNKRVVFLEMLLQPFLTRISGLCTEVAKGNYKNEMKVDQLFIIKYFLKAKNTNMTNSSVGLSGNYLYDTKNLYSGILVNKCSFIPPNMSMPPTEVKHVHPSHFGKVCPISVSAQSPGETVSLIPTVHLDEFGMFQ